MTDVTNKHLLPVYDKPMIYYPIQTLKSLGCTDILIISGVEHSGNIMNLLKNGENFGINITYKVQVLAAHKTVTDKYIKRHYGYSGGVALENHEGWVKYTTGSFGVYKEARDKRNSLKSLDFPGPFVTAYNKGERITVQEALMITKQDWVK
jgi:hypothetical protein